MVFLTGDTHGDIDLRKLNTHNFPEQKALTKDDYLIILGDFGLLDKSNKKELHYLKWLNEKNFTVLFVDGNHEDYNLLKEYPVVDKFGGKVQQIYDNIFHLMRGEIYTIEDKTFFVMGGAESHSGKLITMDEYKKHKKRYTIIGDDYVSAMVIGRDWFKEEMPNNDELQYGLTNLSKYNNKVDYILSHCASNSVEDYIGRKSPKDKEFDGKHICDYFDELEDIVDYSCWYFGHYHRDEKIDDKHYCLYQKIVKL